MQQRGPRHACGRVSSECRVAHLGKPPVLSEPGVRCVVKQGRGVPELQSLRRQQHSVRNRAEQGCDAARLFASLAASLVELRTCSADTMVSWPEPANTWTSRGVSLPAARVLLNMSATRSSASPDRSSTWSMALQTASKHRQRRLGTKGAELMHCLSRCWQHKKDGRDAQTCSLESPQRLETI